MAKEKRIAKEEQRIQSERDSIERVIKHRAIRDSLQREEEVLHQQLLQKTNLNMEMVAVQGGTFQMGSEAFDDEMPIHSVTVDDFFIGKYPITQAQWKKVMGVYPSKLNNKGCDNCPVEGVSWYDVQEFIKEWNVQTGKNFRLPTEAEWEYAARGGNQSKGYRYSGSGRIDEVAWHQGSLKSTRPVGTKKPNELGIFDMSGNVWEWCEDWYEKEYYHNTSSINPKGPSSGINRVLRGGCWTFHVDYCGVSSRFKDGPHIQSSLNGFRIALNSK